MLKLEKIGKKWEINIALRRRDTFFSAPLLKAFGIALVLHVLAGVLFQVSPFRITGSQTLFPPVFVEAQLASDAENAVVALLEAEEISPRYVKEPRLSTLAMPVLPMSTTLECRPVPLSAPIVCPLDCVAKDRDLSPLDLLSMQRKKVPTKPIEIIFSGDLADRKILASGLPSSQESIASAPIRLVYSVQVDDRSGTVFWYDLHGINENSALVAAAEKILKEVRFQMLKDSFVTVGEVEIHFNEKVAG